MSLAQIDKILTEHSLSKLHTYLRKQSNDSLATVSAYDPLDELNPAVHSLGYLFILYVASGLLYLALTDSSRKARVARPAKKDSAQSIMERIALFLQSFDPKQARAAPTECTVPLAIIFYIL